jgi:hypothetical protein
MVWVFRLPPGQITAMPIVIFIDYRLKSGYLFKGEMHGCHSAGMIFFMSISPLSEKELFKIIGSITSMSQQQMVSELSFCQRAVS